MVNDEQRAYIDRQLLTFDRDKAISNAFERIEGGIYRWQENDPEGLTVVLNAPTASEEARQIAADLTRRLGVEVTVVGDEEPCPPALPHDETGTVPMRFDAKTGAAWVTGVGGSPSFRAR